MAIVVRSPKDFWTGVIYTCVGAGAFVIARNYAAGSAGRMGPGYFPTIVSVLLSVVGLITIVRSFRQPGERITSVALRPLILIVASVVAFGLLIERAGLVIASLVLVLMCAAASQKFRLEWTAALGMFALVALCSLVFVTGLGVPMPLVGTWFGF